MRAQSTPPYAVLIKRRRRRMGCQVALLVVVLLAVFTGFVCRHLWNATPKYWTDNEAFLKSHDNSDLLDMADRAEKRLLSELTDAGPEMDTAPGENPPTTSGDTNATAPSDLTSILGSNLNKPRKIHLSLAEVNAWLAVKLETWAAYQNVTIPPQLGGYMVTTEGQSLVFAFQYKGQGITQIFSVVSHVNMLPDGQARLTIDSLRGGELPLPTGMTLNQVRKSVGNGANGDEVGRAIAAIDGKVFSPVHNLDSARRIRLLDYKLRPDGADVTVQTELRPGVTLPENPPPQP